MNNVAVDIGVEKPSREEVEEVLKELGSLKNNNFF
jgi:signal recognition particle subunit SEC65